MKIQNIIFSFLIVFLPLNANALTEADCRTRVNNAMHNSDKLGGNDADAYRWAQNAANECYKELARQRGVSSTGTSSNSSDSGNTGTIAIIVLMLGAFTWMIFRPRLATEKEARAAYREISSYLKEDPSDHPAIKKYKRESLEGLDGGLKYILEQIGERNTIVTQYFVKDFVKEGLAELRKKEAEVKATGKIKIEITHKYCRNCRAINGPSKTVCESCGKPLRSTEEIVKGIEEMEAEDLRKQPLIAEQNEALKKGLKFFGLVIESRAKALGNSQLARVCYGYLTGKLVYSMSFSGFDYSDRDEIYVREKPDELFEDIQFPVDADKAAEIAFHSIASAFERNSIPGRKENLWDKKVRVVYAWAELFAKAKKSENDDQKFLFSPLYSYILSRNAELFSKLQQSIAKWEVERHIKYEKHPYASVADYLGQRVPFAERLSAEFIEECRLLGEKLIEEKLERKAKRDAKKASKPG